MSLNTILGILNHRAEGSFAFGAQDTNKIGMTGAFTQSLCCWHVVSRTDQNFKTSRIRTMSGSISLSHNCQLCPPGVSWYSYAAP